jgi:murein DD-endopeptidase MepM/ murein hydrolase activator NlpD
LSLVRAAAVACALALGACAGGGGLPVEVLSGYRDLLKPCGFPRVGAHPAVDFGGAIGDPVYAAADGRVMNVLVDAPQRPCGNGLRLAHQGFDRYTLYCQMLDVSVRVGDEVKRGQQIGRLGISGEPSWSTRPIPMLHFGLYDQPRYRGDGQLEGTFDPMGSIVGCFDPAATYPTDRLVLTYPVRCRK